MLYNLGLNIVLPTLVLIWGGDVLGWSPSVVLIVALLGPLGFGAYELFVQRKVNHVSILGVVSVLATGGIGLLGLDAGWVAIKEAALPLVLGTIVLVSAFTRWPAIKTFLFDANVLDVARIDAAVAERGAEGELARLLRLSTFALAASFVLSAGLNYGLAVWIVHSPTGSEAFNQEIGQMTAWSFPVIVVPTMAITLGVMAWLLKGLQTVTGLDLDALVGDGKGSREERGGQPPAGAGPTDEP